MRVPYFLQGALFAPLLIGLILLLKLLCPGQVGDGCFVDYFAVPMFFPVIVLYATFGGTLLLKHEFWFLLVYWSFLGFLVGLIFDLRVRNKAQMTNVQ